jgi:SAM-dependent methyltransferase
MPKIRKLCNLCGSHDASFFIEAKGVDALCDKLFQLIRCDSCGLVSLDTEVRPEEAKSLDFKEYYGSETPSCLGIFGFIMNFFMLMRVRKIEKVSSPGAILDIGCGNGDFLKKMNSGGWDCYGLDTSPYAVEITGKIEGVHAFCGGIDDVRLPENFFDAVTFWQSFEHMSRPSDLLRKVRGLLKDDGVIFISVPNIESIEARISVGRWLGLDLPRHLYFYSPKTIRSLLEKNGFKIIRLSKNSIEYNFPFLAQTFFNAMGCEPNLLYQFFKRSKYTERPDLFLRLYTIFLMVMLLPVVLFGTAVIYFINIASGNGPVVEVFAGKRKA